MILKIYHLGGEVKYSGISSSLPKDLKYKFRNPSFKVYDIGGIMLYLFQENSFLKEFNENGDIMDMGFLKNGQIRKEMIKKNSEEERFSTPPLHFQFNSTLFLDYFRNLYSSTITNTIDNTRDIVEDVSDIESTVFSYDEYEDEYEGEVIHGVPNGKGIFYEKKNCPQYIGYWLDGKQNGKGIYYIKNEKIYYGEWKENKRVGNGISYFKGKKTFEGIWKNDFPFFGKIYSNEQEVIYNGQFSNYIGKFIFYSIEEKETYSGSFKNGKRNGYGDITDINHIVQYKGHWEKNQKNGYGEENTTYLLYRGYWKDNKYNGYGVSYETSVDDDEIFVKTYSGNWKNGKKEGEGISFHENGNIYFEGEFKYDEFYKGIQYYENGNLMYGGYFKDNDFEGEGILYYPYSQNICFDGTFKQGKPFYGISYNSDGIKEDETKIIDNNYYTFGRTFYEDQDEKYKGYFKNGIYHGEGTLTKGEENKCKGTFIDGFYWNGNDSLQYIDFYINPIIFKGSLQNERYYTGIEYIYEIDDFNDILYENEPISYKIWKNGEPFNEEKERFERKQEMKILSYLETKQKKKLENTCKKDYLCFLKNKYQITEKEKFKKRELIDLIENEYSSKKNEIYKEEDKYDLFGNEILNPVKGFDGEIYDESSMIYLFERDEKMEFKNISYMYNEKNERIPNYPIMSSGKPLNGYQKGDVKIYENDREYIKKC